MLEDLTDRLAEHLPEDPRALAQGLYGVSWRSSVVQDSGSSWRTRRLPPPLQVAPLLAAALEGLAAHDGRSTHMGRGLGWWLRDVRSGSWQEADTDSLGLEVLPALQSLTLEAQEAAAECSRALRTTERKTSGRLHEERSSALSDARLRATLLEALAALVASGSSGRWGNVVQALRSSLRLPDSVVRRLVLEGLRDSALLDGWDEGSRMPPRVLWERYEAAGGALPERTFLRALPALLGDLRKVQGSRFYVLPDLDSLEVAS